MLGYRLVPDRDRVHRGHHGHDHGPRLDRHDGLVVGSVVAP